MPSNFCLAAEATTAKTAAVATAPTRVAPTTSPPAGETAEAASGMVAFEGELELVSSTLVAASGGASVAGELELVSSTSIAVGGGASLLEEVGKAKGGTSLLGEVDFFTLLGDSGRVGDCSTVGVRKGTDAGVS